jgi:MOSC domain-containing protein YiiM
MESAGRLLSVNVGSPREITYRKRSVTTSIWKAPVAGRVAARDDRLEGDRQSDARYHGGYDKAVYAYAREDYEWWEAELGRPLAPGTFGENLTTEGIDVTGARVGERWEVGDVVLEVSEPRLPCFKLGIRVEEPRFVKRFGAAGRPGAYLRIVEEGELGAGDPIRVVDRPDHPVTVGLMARARLHDASLWPLLLPAAPALPEKWRRRAQRRVRAAAAAG